MFKGNKGKGHRNKKNRRKNTKKNKTKVNIVKKQKKEKKQKEKMSKRKRNRPRFVNLAINIDVFNKKHVFKSVGEIKALHTMGKLTNLVVLDNKYSSPEYMQKVRNLLEKNNAGWLFSHIVFHTDKHEEEGSFKFRVLRNFDIDAYLATSSQDNKVIRRRHKFLRIKTLSNWPEAVRWMKTLNGQYVIPAESMNFATDVIDTTVEYESTMLPWVG